MSWFHAHEPLLTQKRDATGKTVYPHVIIWRCGICDRELGETCLQPKFKLVSALRFMAKRMKREAA